MMLFTCWGKEKSRVPLVIECVGAGGIGKTSLCDALSEQLRAGGHRVVDGRKLRMLDERRGGLAMNNLKRAHEKYLFAKCLMRFPRFAWAMQGYARSCGEPRAKKMLRARRALGLVSILADLVDDREREVVLVDEGITNVLWSLSVGVEMTENRHYLDEAMKAYINRVPVQFILLDASAAALTERVFSRDHPTSRFSRQSDSAARADFAGSLGHQRSIEALIPEGRVIARADAGRDLNAVTRSVMTQLAASGRQLFSGINVD